MSIYPFSMNYEAMLQRGKQQLPENIRNTERFEVMKVKGIVQGNKTILSNMTQIADQLQRPVEHLLKYLNKELAARGEMKDSYTVFNTKLPAQRINEKIDVYVEQYVICKECGRPDSKMAKSGPAWLITCQACGAKYTAKGI
jgi:translation initiation factor 2 subunit 2